MEESNKEKNSENPLTKGWNSFIYNIQENFQNFQQALKDQTEKGIEDLKKNQEKVETFFLGVKEKWKDKLSEWNDEIKRKGIETKEQLEAGKQKIAQDFEKW